MTDQEKKNHPQEPEKQDRNQTEQQAEDFLALDTDVEIEDLVDSIAEKEKAMKTEKKG